MSHARAEILGRIIPARAGFTGRPTNNVGGAPDHPRSRGVYAAVAVGSAEESWIIPARAGFTVRFEGGPPADGDHPRSRGVYDSGAP